MLPSQLWKELYNPGVPHTATNKRLAARLLVDRINDELGVGFFYLFVTESGRVFRDIRPIIFYIDPKKVNAIVSALDKEVLDVTTE